MVLTDVLIFKQFFLFGKFFKCLNFCFVCLFIFLTPLQLVVLVVMFFYSFAWIVPVMWLFSRSSSYLKTGSDC